MDIKREGVARKKRIKYGDLLRADAGGAGIGHLLPFQAQASGALGRMGHGLARHGEARIPCCVDVKGSGTLVPEDIVWIPAAFDSQVSKIMVSSGRSR